jgi:hypothetical protein
MVKPSSIYKTSPESAMATPYSHIKSDTPMLCVLYNTTVLLLKMPDPIIRLNKRQATE